MTLGFRATAAKHILTLRGLTKRQKHIYVTLNNVKLTYLSRLRVALLKLPLFYPEVEAPASSSFASAALKLILLFF